MAMLTNKLTVNNLRAMLLDSKSANFVDLRDEFEFNAGHVAGFKNIPLSELLGRLHELDKTKPVVLFCTNGKKAAVAADVLINQGFCDVMEVAGGLLSWRVQNFPLLKAV